MRVNVTRWALAVLTMGMTAFAPAALLAAQPEASVPHRGGEANLVLPDLSSGDVPGVRRAHAAPCGHSRLGARPAVRHADLRAAQALPVHSSMLEISELIYETCKTYLLQQGKFLLILELFIGAIIAFYFGVLRVSSTRDG